MKKRLFLAAVMLGVMTVGAWAQKPVITFDEKEYDFKNVNESDGNVTHIFEFKNTGNAPLIIQNVTTSCGCTTPEWTKTPIEPGKNGNITVIYSTPGRPGNFVKQVFITSNATNERETLTIKGNVIPNANAQQQVNSFPIQIGDLRINNKVVQFNNIDKGSTQTRIIGMKNGSNANLTVALVDVPAYIDVKVTPQTLKPAEEGNITLTFDTKKCTEWGPVNDDAYLVLNGKRNASELYKVNISANMVENFSKVDKRQAPIVEIKSPNLYFGNIKQGSKIRGKVTMKNVGNGLLEIRRIVNNNSDIAIHPMRATVKGGKEETLRVDIDSKYLPKGEYKKTFSVQTNDPVNTYITYVIGFSVM